MTMISNNNLWFSPLRTYTDYLDLAQRVGSDVLMTDRSYERVLEAHSVAILCFALFIADGTPWWLQLCKDDPPDALIMRHSPDVVGDHDILGVEVTSYVRNKNGLPSDSLLDQLKKTKMFKDYHKYTDHDVILVHLGIGFNPDFGEIQEYMYEIDAPYEAWFIQEVQSAPDTITRMTICNRITLRQRDINIGEAADLMRKQKIFSTVTTVRVGSIDKVGSKESAYIEGTAWSTMT